MRAVLRLAGVALHLLKGCLLTACILRFMGPRRRAAVRRRWAQQLLALLGVHVELSGQPRGAALWVSNHVSWLDVFVLQALAPVLFVCKDEVRRWPLLGWLVARHDVLFLRRGNAAAAAGLVAAAARALEDGHCVVVFPEGTCSDGSQVLHFHAAACEAAVRAGCITQPVALGYFDAAGLPARQPAYHGDISLWTSLRAVAAMPRLAVRVDFLAALPPAGRKLLARRAQTAIGAQLARRAAHAAELPPACAPRGDVAALAGV